MQPTTVSRKTAWLRVVLLAIAAFVFNTTEFVPVGLLSDIAADFSMQTADVGIMLTIYAWVVALLSLPLMLLTRNIERRLLLGVPIGRVVGQYLGWRTTFGAIGLSALVLMIMLVRILPRLPSEHTGSLSSVPMLFRRPALVSMYLLVTLVVTAHYTAYSYIEPFMQTVAHSSGNFTTLLLLLFGSAGIVGSLLFSTLGNKFPSALLIAAIALITLCMGLLIFAAVRPAAISTLCVVWGVAMMMIGLGMQVRVLSLAPDATDVAMSLMSGIYNIGIGAGALLGNQVSLHLSMAEVGNVGGMIGLVALLWCVYIFRRYPQLRSNG